MLNFLFDYYLFIILTISLLYHFIMYKLVKQYESNKNNKIDYQNGIIIIPTNKSALQKLPIGQRLAIMFILTSLVIFGTNLLIETIFISQVALSKQTLFGAFLFWFLFDIHNMLTTLFQLKQLKEDSSIKGKVIFPTTYSLKLAMFRWKIYAVILFFVLVLFPNPYIFGGFIAAVTKAVQNWFIFKKVSKSTDN